MLQRDGWAMTRQKGSHRQLKHPSKPGTVTVAGRLSDEMPRGTLNSVLRQAGLK
jgi:predicted RNA binding protein YcfA (HicA-like mRNA interferase family)